MVGLVPLVAVETLEDETIDRLPGFRKRLQWFLDNRRDLAQVVSYWEPQEAGGHGRHLLAIPSRERLQRVLGYLLDENEFLWPVRRPLALQGPPDAALRLPDRRAPGAGRLDPASRVQTSTAAIRTGGRSGSLNYLLIEALERYHHFYGDTLRVACPTATMPGTTPGQLSNLQEVARKLPAAAGPALPPRRGGPSPLGRRRPPLRRRSVLARPDPVSRVFPRRHRPRARGQPPNRLDRPGDSRPGGLLPPGGMRNTSRRERRLWRTVNGYDTGRSRAASVMLKHNLRGFTLRSAGAIAGGRSSRRWPPRPSRR